MLTKQSGIDKTLLKLLRASINRGVRSETFAKILEEMHSLKYYDDYIEQEYGIVFEEENGVANKGVFFSSFSSRKFYNGAIPSGRHLMKVFSHYSMQLQSYFETKMKKWPATGCAWTQVTTLPK